MDDRGLGGDGWRGQPCCSRSRAGATSNFREGRFDLGTHGAGGLEHGERPPARGDARPRRASRSCDSAVMLDPFLALLAPLWLLWPSPLVLALAQIVVVSLGALPVFWLGRRHLGSERGRRAARTRRTSPTRGRRRAPVAPIHPVTFAIPLFLFCIWFLETDRFVLFTVCALLAMSTGELMGLPIALLGVWFALARGRRRAGGLDRASRVGVDCIRGLCRRAPLRGRPAACTSASTTTSAGRRSVSCERCSPIPAPSLGALVESHDIAYLVWLGLPLLFLFVLSPGLAAVALPQLLANGLSDFRSMTRPAVPQRRGDHPVSRSRRRFSGSRSSRAPRRGLAAAAVLVCSGTLAFAVAPWPRAVGAVPLGGRETPSASRVRRSDGCGRTGSRGRRGERIQHCRRASLGSAVRLLRSDPRPRGVGRDRPPRPVGRAARLADPDETSEGRPRSRRCGSNVTRSGRRSSSRTASWCSASRFWMMRGARTSSDGALSCSPGPGS